MRGAAAEKEVRARRAEVENKFLRGGRRSESGRRRDRVIHARVKRLQSAELRSHAGSIRRGEERALIEINVR